MPHASDAAFGTLALLLVSAAALGAAGNALRLPLIVSYIAVGIVAGPSLLDLPTHSTPVALFAELGVALLLFLVGLKLDLSLLRSLGPVALVTGLAQVGATGLLTGLVALAAGVPPLTSLYLALALAFSSTIVVVKLLSDRRELDALHGRLALGVLIVQDLVVILSMLLLSALAAGQATEGPVTGVARVLGAGLGALAAVGLFIRFVADPLAQRLSATPELLMAFAIGWAALVAALGAELGFGKELGGLLAGVSLASTPFREAIAARLAPLRDFLLLFFFVSLGLTLDLGAFGGANLGVALGLALAVLLLKPLILVALIGALGYRRRTGFLTGLACGQISEFSLILFGLGVSLGHVSAAWQAIITVVALVTIAGSTWAVGAGRTLFRVFDRHLRVFERRVRLREEPPTAHHDRYDVVLFGLGRYGLAIARALRQGGLRVLGVDFNPQALRHARQDGFAARFGDATDPEFLAHLPLAEVQWAVSAVPEHDTGVTHDDPKRSLIGALRGQGFGGRVAVATHSDAMAARLRAAGADLVLLPFRDAAQEAARLVLAGESGTGAAPTDPAGQRAL